VITAPSPKGFVELAHINRQEPEPEEFIQVESLPKVPEKKKVEAVQTAKTQPPTGSHQDWMIAAGISSSDFGYVDYIVSHESSWRHLAVNSIGATGLCQALPGSKMATAGQDWQTNPVTQLKWCDSYAKSRYGGWAKAYSFWQSSKWW
jgi:hypothetical protein